MTTVNICDPHFQTFLKFIDVLEFLMTLQDDIEIFHNNLKCSRTLNVAGKDPSAGEGPENRRKEISVNNDRAKTTEMRVLV